MKKYVWLLALTLLSCGARKVNKAEETKSEVINTVAVENKNITTSTNTDFTANISKYHNAITIEAKDNLKPFTYEGKTYANVVIKKEIKRDTIYIQAVSAETIKDSSVINTKTKAEVKERKATKNIERKSNTINIVFFILILIIVLFLVYRLFKVFI